MERKLAGDATQSLRVQANNTSSSTSILNTEATFGKPFSCLELQPYLLQSKVQGSGQIMTVPSPARGCPPAAAAGMAAPPPLRTGCLPDPCCWRLL